MADTDDIWATKSDEELLDAAGELGDYTEQAERQILAELRRRHLPTPGPPMGRCVKCGRYIWPNRLREACGQCAEPFPQAILQALGDGDPQIALVRVLQTADAGLMGFAKSLLDSEGIANSSRGDNLQDLFGVGRFGGHNYITGPAELWVRADDEERARALLEGVSDVPVEPESGPDENADEDA